MPALDVRRLLKQARDQTRQVSSGASAFATAGSQTANLLNSRLLDVVPVRLVDHSLSQESSVSLDVQTALTPPSPTSLQVHLFSCLLLQQALGDILYIPDFVTHQEEACLLRTLQAAPAARWTQAGERQMQNWGGRPGEAVVREVRHHSGRH